MSGSIKVPHKHAAVIKAWADGAKIQTKLSDNSWMNCAIPSWFESSEYRVKPETIKFRNVLMKALNGYTITCVSYERYDMYEDSPSFTRWVGEEQEVEL